METTLYDFTVLDSKGAEFSLSELKGKVVLLVNTASKCGYTRQYAGLEALYKQYKEKDFVIVAFPCNQFGGQEPGTEAEIVEFCSLEYGVTFPIMSKIAVNGKNADPLYTWLKEQKPGRILWNFTKFLIDREGRVVERFPSKVEPEALQTPLEEVL